jgi:autotransporter-associated beta strand protein
VGGTGFVPKNVAEAASHEVGHTLGLAHDGVEGGDGATQGWGNWVPIMGKSYYRPITHWNKGEYASPNNTQDDLAVMLTQGALYRPDDHGSTLATATKLSADSSSATVSGVIGRNTDLDFFRIDAVGGSLVLNIKPITVGANLRLEVKLYDSGGALLQTATSADVSGASTGGTRPVTLTRTVTAGAFYFSVDGIGNGDPLTPGGYSDYGSLGHYTGTISGVVPGGFTWTSVTAGTKQWNTTTNWASGTLPNAATIGVRVNNDISGDQTIQLASATTVGSLDLGDSNSTHAFTLAPSGGSLVFNNSGVAASLSKTSGGNDTLAVPVSLVDALVVTQSASGTLSFSGGISGAQALTKEGAGTVVFSSANTYTGDTTIDDGLLRLDHAAGLPGGIDNAVGSGESTLSFKGGVLGLATGDFTRQIGTGVGQLDWDPDTGGAGSGGFAAFGADREVRLNNGMGNLSWATAILGSGSILILSHPTATHTLNFRNGISFSNAKRTVQVEDGAAAVDAILSGSLLGTAATPAGFTKTGPGVLTLTNSNTYPGVTTVADGVLRLQHASALPSGNLELTGGGVLGFGAGDLTTRIIGTGANQVQWLGSGGFAAFGATRAVKFSATSINWTATDFIDSGRVLILSHDTADATLDWQQPISLAGYQRSVQVEDGSAAIDAKMSGVIAGGTSGTSVNIFNKIGAGTLAFTAQNTYWGETIINSGTLMIGDGGNTGGVSQNTTIITVEPGATLAVNRSDTVTQGTNPFKVAVSGDGGFTQAGSGTTVLMLANTYIGPTTIEAGTLTLGAAGVLPDGSEIFIGNATLATGSFAETAGRLDITSTATVQLGAGATLGFADSSAVDWTGGALTLTGTFVSGSSLRFGTNSSGLTPAQLARISASGFNSFALDSNGYLTASSGMTFSSWIAGAFGAGTIPTDRRGPNDDFDQDGVSNLMEFAIAGQDPTVPNGPACTFSGGLLSFTKRGGVSGVSYAIEASADLGVTDPWEEVTGGSYVNTEGAISYVLAAGSARIFVRLRVTSL